jgi:hypothetical protein
MKLEDDAMSGTTTLTALPEWKALEAHYEKVKDLKLRTLFRDCTSAVRGI